MQSIDINLIEQRARALRAQEIQRVSGVCAERMALYFQLMGRSLGVCWQRSANSCVRCFHGSPGSITRVEWVRRNPIGFYV